MPSYGRYLFGERVEDLQGHCVQDIWPAQNEVGTGRIEEDVYDRHGGDHTGRCSVPVLFEDALESGDLGVVDEVRDAPRRPGVALRLLAGALVLGAATGVLGLIFVPASTYQVGPGHISAKATPGRGATSLLFPPLGSVHAATHPAPVVVNLSLVGLDIPALADQISTASDRRELTSAIDSDLRILARSLALRMLLAGAAAGAIAAALLPRRRWPYVVAGALGGLAAIGALVSATAVTFDVDRLQEPRFTGALTRAPVVIDAIGRGEISIPEVTSRYEGAAERLSNLMALLATPEQDPRHDSVAILHISDVHSNPIGIEVARQLITQFEIDAVVDTGDLTNFGVQLETRIVDLVESLPVPYIFVPGNHDSAALRSRLRDAENVTVLDGSTTELAGVRILGWGDPTYTNWNALPPEEAAERRREEAAAVVAAVEEHEPDVLAVHDHRLAGDSLGTVPLVLSGHYHRQIVEELRGTRVLGVGTTGASGFKSFTLEAEMDYEAQIVYFRGGTAVAFDYVTFTGLGGDFQIQRRLLESLDLVGPPAEGEELEVPVGDEEVFETPSQ